MTTVSNVSSGEHRQPQVAPTPTQQVVNDANRIAYGVDELGRTLGVIRLSGKLRRRVLQAMSIENGQKPDLFMQAMIACSCVSINGDPVVFPTNEILLNALMDRLDDEGSKAILEIQAEHFVQAKEQEIKN